MNYTTKYSDIPPISYIIKLSITLKRERQRNQHYLQELQYPLKHRQ